MLLNIILFIIIRLYGTYVVLKNFKFDAHLYMYRCKKKHVFANFILMLYRNQTNICVWLFIFVCFSFSLKCCCLSFLLAPALVDVNLEMVIKQRICMYSFFQRSIARIILHICRYVISFRLVNSVLLLISFYTAPCFSISPEFFVVEQLLILDCKFFRIQNQLRSLSYPV